MVNKEIPSKRNGFYFLKVSGKTERYPSVTEIISVLDKPALRYWYGQMAARAALADPTITEKEAVAAVSALSRKAAERGSIVHDITEALDYGREPKEILEEYAGYIKAYKTFLADFKPKVILNEQIVFNPEYGYAGQLDRVYQIGDQFVLGDVKTSSAIYKDMVFQTSAYLHTTHQFNKQTHEVSEMPKLDRAMIILLDKEGSYQIGVMEDKFDAFLALKKIWEVVNEEKLNGN